jgi:endonuclease YncB( thermonuclease family)
MRPRLASLVLLASICAAQPEARNQDPTDDTPPKVPARDFTGQTACPVVRVPAANELVVRLDNQETTVRLIGTYVPQSGPDADEARAFTTRLLAGEAVYLAYEPNWPQRDREERVWAYVYRAPDGLFVNLELVRQGYARVSSAERFEHQKLLRAYEQLAQKNRKGLWSPPPARAPTSQPVLSATSEPAAQNESPDSDAVVYVTVHGKKYHRKDCQYVRSGGIALTLKEAKARGCSRCLRCKPPE